MEKIHVFTDSSSDIPPEEVAKYGIELIPLTISLNGRVFREYYDIKPQEYWKILRDTPEVPATAMIPPAQFLDCYERAAARGCTHVIGILINGNGSGTWQAACMARDMFQQEHGNQMQIEVLDSQSYTYIYGHVVTLAAKLREHGDSFDAILSVIKSRLNRIEAFLGVYSLKHLKKSGRITGGAAFIGEALGFRPVSHICAGSVTVCDKVRGEKGLVPALVRHVKKRAVQPQTQTALLLTGDVPTARVDELEQLLRKECGFASVHRGLIGPTVLTNTGPDALAVAFYGPPGH